MKLSCIRKKRSLIFQVKMISKDNRKAIVPSFMFLFNSSKVCHSLCKENKQCALPLGLGGELEFGSFEFEGEVRKFSFSGGLAYQGGGYIS